MFKRLRRLWELSGQLSSSEDEKLASSMKSDFYSKSKLDKKRKNRDQKLATILSTNDPFEGITSNEDQDNENTTDK